MTKAVYPGSLDPITHGHIGAIRDTAAAFGEVIVAIGVNPGKNYMFSLAEREELARQALKDVPNVTVTSFSGLLVHFLVRNNLDVVVRGVRNGQDLDDNIMQETIGWQQALAKDLKAFYVPARPGQAFTSSTALKGVLKEQGDTTLMAPLSTIQATQARMQGQYFYGVTGVSGSGKSSICRKFAEAAEKRGIPLIHIDMDKIGHAILSTEQDPLYEKIRGQIKSAFGPEVLDDSGFIVRKKLGEIVFGDPEKLKILNSLMHDAIFFRLNDMLRGRKGIFLIDAALLAETDRLSLVNNQMLMVEGDPQALAQRLQQRDNLTPEQVERRLSSQFTGAAKIAIIEEKIKADHFGHLQRLTNENLADADIDRAFDATLKQVDIYGELRINAFLKSIGVAETQEAYAAIRKLHGGNDRFYHTLAHIVEGLDRLPEIAAQVADKDALQLAWLFRSAVFDPQKKDNEDKSAALLEKMCKAWGVDAGLAARASQMIVASKRGNTAASEDSKILADLELLAFGADTEGYKRAEDNIRREYGFLSAKEWAQQHNDFLKTLETECYRSDCFKASTEAAAAKNIKASLSLKP